MVTSEPPVVNRDVAAYPGSLASLTPERGDLYIVRMKKVTASEARRQWFRLLDEAAQGEVIVVQRKGRRIVLRREDVGKAKASAARPGYRRLLRVPRVDQADRWSWEWKAEGSLARRQAPGR